MAPVVLVIFVFKTKEYVVWCARDADDACVCLLMSSCPALKDIFVSELFMLVSSPSLQPPKGV